MGFLRKHYTLAVSTTDNDLQREISQALSLVPYDVEFFNNSSNLIESICENSIQVCLFDLHNKPQSRINLLYRLFRQNNYLSLIILTDNYSKMVTQKILMLPIHYYLEKPINKKELLIAVHSAFKFNRDRENTNYLKEDFAALR